MLNRKIVIDISEMNLPEDVEKLLCMSIFEGGIAKIDTEFFEYNIDGYDGDEIYKILYHKIKGLGIDLDEEGYILITCENE